MSPLLTCPLCSQPGFQTLDSLRRGLISAATRQVVCPVCHDVLFGLDKFTIHLFCHSVEHQQVTNNPLPSPRVEQMQVNQQQINTHCTSSQTDFSSITEDQTSVHSIEKVNTSSNNTQISNISIPTSHSVFNPITVQQRHVQAIEKVNKKTVHNVGATNVDNLRSQIVEYEQAHKPQELKCKESLEPKTADLAMKSTLLSDSELMDTSQSTGSSTSIYVSSDDLKRTAATHENISAQCSADQHHSKVNLPLAKTVKEIVRCDLCGFAFDDLSILAIHIQLVHSLGNNSDTTDDKIQTSKTSKQEKIAEDKRQFPCHLCSKAFKMRGSLMVHLRENFSLQRERQRIIQKRENLVAIFVPNHLKRNST
ncbi:hypothetical protein C0J52_11317 [Blattella germanica]|nr:hypothetical protein C0J52_11317 [Blattella germanica]